MIPARSTRRGSRRPNKPPPQRTQNAKAAGFRRPFLIWNATLVKFAAMQPVDCCHANKTVVEEVINRLREYGYLDDQHFALSFASNKVKQKPTGRRRLERDLMMKKVDRAVADEALDLVFAETPEEELIDRAIEKRIRLRGRPVSRLEAKSLFDHLLRQGFSFELVSDRVRAVSREVAEDED